MGSAQQTSLNHGIEDYTDVERRKDYNSILEKRARADMNYVLQQMRLKGRDNGQLLMQ